MRSAKLWVLLGVVLAGSLPVLAQTNVNEEQGMKPYDSFHGGDLDSVSMTNGGLVIHIPLVSFPQRGNLDLSFSVYANAKQWRTRVNSVECGNPNDPNGCTPLWIPIVRGTSQPQFGGVPVEGAYVASSLDWLPDYECNVEPGNDNNGNTPTYNWSAALTAPDGNVHNFGSGTSTSFCPGPPFRALDASGILQSDGSTIIMPNGTRFTFDQYGVFSAATDTNGNRITMSYPPPTYTDSMGRIIAPPPSSTTTDVSNCPSGTAASKVWIVPGLAGGTRTFKFCYSNISIFTDFGQGATEYGPINNVLLTAIVLPDLTMWTFAYDHYGDVTRLGFPTEGSITYTYVKGPITCGSDTPLSMVVATRTVDANDGTGGHTWTYSYAPPTMVVTSPPPDSNDTVHTIVDPITGQVGCSMVDTQVQHYQGSRNGGALLKTEATQYSANPNTLTTPGSGASAINVVPHQITVTTRDGHTSKVVNTWDSGNTEAPYGTAVPIVFGSVLQRDEYDFSNTLIRSTLNRYLWQDNATYKTNNFLSLPEWSTVYNGAAPPSSTLPVCSSTSTPACIGQTKYGYDEFSPLAPSGIGVPTHVAPPAGEPYRGNLTTSSHWLDTASAFISSTSTYYDTGMRATSVDPLLHATSYTYSGTYLGAYLTQSNMPDTQMPDPGAPIVHHIISGDYDFNTGLLTSFTDENGQPYTYTYDSLMLRLTQGNHPDGGITKFFYPDPNTVERQRLITGTTYDDFKVKFDGLGRPYQTQQLTPDCQSYIKVDTTYDTVGRAKTVSNPYCLTSETTYGITTSDYDALSRTTKTTKQDGSFTTVKYEDTPGDTSGAPLVCTTVTDESGKKRQTCSDALGRLVKVLEPNPAAAATFANGSVTVSGTEQSGNAQPATPGQATITISGHEQSVTNCIRSRCFTTYDTGTVTITVAGFSAKTINYGQGDTPATVAWKLSCAFHNDSASAADASCPTSAGSSTQVVLTARATGTASNYSFTTSSATSDGSVNFFTASFTAAPASGAFTGGQNASSTPDTGNVTITINGTPYATSFGSGDNPTTIASRLATAISAGPYANATSSGGTVNLTSKTAGTAGDYSLAASYTWNSAQFTNPSFTTSTSGSAMGGALDAGGINNNPFVTIYQYDARGDLLCVHQKATDTSTDVACTGTTPPAVPAAWRQRFFTYDSFSRLLTAMNPELNSTGSTVITYGYDNNSRLTSKIEPAPNAAWGSSSTVTVNYSYDALNRLLDTTYTDGTTQGTSHRYDYTSFLGQTFAYPIGREVAATTANNTIESFTSYDPMGRVASTTQCHPGVTGCKTFTVNNYDKLGDLTSLTYPGNAFTVTYGYDNAARLTTATDSNGVIYAQNPTFLAAGMMKEFTSPNFNNNKYHVDYNNRLQPIEIWAGAGQGASALFDKQYSYGTSGSNNGNIFTITNVKDSTRTQNFTYDPLNRLLTAGDNGHWANGYTYDAWGNLTNKTPGSPAGENMNQAADTNNHLSGLTYDAAGNVQNDGGSRYAYDAENRIICTNPDVNFVCNTSSVIYTYDAYGRRIQKSTGINYWYGPGGQVFAETDSAGNWTNYIFFGGQRLARNIPQTPPAQADIKYYITDHLHSTGMFVDQRGASYATDVLDDNDFYPWGGVVPGVGKTTSNNTIKFTGQYRDTDTAANLDYFGARYYSNTIGRFMSPDWAAKPTTVPYAKFGDPQSLNLYSYVENGPINRIDADGHCFTCVPGWNGSEPNGSPAGGGSDGRQSENPSDVCGAAAHCKITYGQSYTAYNASDDGKTLTVTTSQNIDWVGKDKDGNPVSAGTITTTVTMTIKDNGSAKSTYTTSAHGMKYSEKAGGMVRDPARSWSSHKENIDNRTAYGLIGTSLGASGDLAVNIGHMNVTQAVQGYVLQLHDQAIRAQGREIEHMRLEMQYERWAHVALALTHMIPE